MLLAIAYQESGFDHRIQLIGGSRHWWESLNGPARGFWQFERAGVRGVLEHHTTENLAAGLACDLKYPPRVGPIHRGLAHNDVMAVCFARLLLWTLPQALPAEGDEEGAWLQYIDAWRPGKPHRQRWAASYATALELVEAM